MTASAVRLADLLVGVGVDPSAVAAARAEAESRNVSLAAVVLQRGLIDARRLAALVSQALGLTTHHLDAPTSALPASTSLRLRAIVLGVVTIDGDRRHLVGMTDPTDVIARLEIIRALGGAIHCVVVEDDALQRALGEVTASDRAPTALRSVAGTTPTASTDFASHAELFARIANTTNVRERSAWDFAAIPASQAGETQPTVRTRLLRALASHIGLGNPVAVLSELRLLVIATEDAARERVVRELAGIPRLRLAMSTEAALEAASRATFDAAVLVGSIDDVAQPRAGLPELAEQTCLVVVSTTGLESTVVAAAGASASGLEDGRQERDIGLPRAIFEALVAATGAPRQG